MEGRELDTRLREWVEAGLVTRDQAGAIAEHERVRKATEEGIPIVAEIFGYVGSLLAASAILGLIGEFWPEIGLFGHIALPAVVAVACLLAGVMIARLKGHSAARLSQFLLAAGVVVAGILGGVITNEIQARALDLQPFQRDEWAPFIGFATAAIAGGVVWAWKHTWVQQLVFGLGVGGAFIFGMMLVPAENLPTWLSGVVIVALGLVWGALGLARRLPPIDAALALASAGILIGIVMMAVPEDQANATGPNEWALWLGIAASIGLIAAGIPMKRGVVLAIGAAGVVGFVPATLTTVFEGAIGGPIAMLVTGVLLVGMAIFVAVMLPRLRRNRAETSETPEPPPQISGHVGVGV